MSEAPRQLSDKERTQLKGTLSMKTDLQSETLGFKVRGQPMTQGVPVALIPGSLEGADVSVCGIKGFMLDEVREFTRPDGTRATIDCAAVAALEIVDSPVHEHGSTREIYEILEGSGLMVLGDQIVAVGKGNVVLLPPGVEHGLVSVDPDIPVKVLLSFSPGLAPKNHPDFRDEAIHYHRTSARIAALQKGLQEAARGLVE